MAEDMADQVSAGFDETLGKFIDNLDPVDDAHWTKAGLPDLNVLKEYMEVKVNRKDVRKVRPGFDRETAGEIANLDRKGAGKALGAVPWVGVSPVTVAQAQPELMPDDTGAGMMPETKEPVETEQEWHDRMEGVGRDPIDMFEEMLKNTPTQYRRFNPMFAQALQSYESNRPGILEQRERNKARGRA